MLRKIFLVLAIGLTTCFLHATTFKENLDLAIELKKNGNYTEALTHVERAAKENPNNVNVLFIKGQILIKLDRIKDAIPIFEKLHGALPENTIITQQLANLYHLEDNLAQAIKLNFSLIKKGETSSAIFYNLGSALNHVGLKQEAIPFYRKALELQPDRNPAHIGLGSCLVTLGQFEEGWKEIAWPIFKGKRLDPCSLSGKTILLDCKNPFGDVFFFIRYAQKLKKCGAQVVALVHNLAPLLSMIPYIDKVISQNNQGTYDVKIPVASCSYIFNTTLETIPDNVPYLKAKPSLVSFWKEKLKKDSNFKIGICWKSNSFNDRFIPKTSHRTFNPKLFNNICEIENVTCYSLHTAEINKSLPESLRVCHFDDLDTKHGAFMDTAALITNLDLIITADTSIAHLAGALAKPVWVLLPKIADGRWMLNRNDCPWYPTMRLFRQSKPGAWKPVFETIYKELMTLLG